MASFPDSIFSPASKNTGDTIQASHITDLDGEVVAIEQGFRSGTAPLNSSHSTLAALSVSGGSTFAGSVTVGGPFVMPTASTTLSGGSTRFDNVLVPASAGLLRVSGNSTAIAISGFSTVAGGRLLYVTNVEPSVSVTLLNEDANSSETCRIQLGGSNRTITAGSMVTLIYDGVRGRWCG